MWTTCSSESVFWDTSTAASVAEDASSEPSVANRILVGKMLIVCASSLCVLPLVDDAIRRSLAHHPKTRSPLGHPGCAGEALAGTVFATDSISVDADCDNGRVAL